MHGLNIRCGSQNTEYGRKWMNVETNMNYGHQRHCGGMRKQVQKEIVIIASMVGPCIFFPRFSSRSIYFLFEYIKIK